MPMPLRLLVLTGSHPTHASPMTRRVHDRPQDTLQVQGGLSLAYHRGRRGRFLNMERYLGTIALPFDVARAHEHDAHTTGSWT